MELAESEIKTCSQSDGLALLSLAAEAVGIVLVAQDVAPKVMLIC